jgi:glutamate N-acetyltransferase/amino-acid N-acetyltransferase
MTVNAHNLDSSKVSLDAISKYLQNNEVQLEVTVGKGSFTETVWGCDLTKEYIEINAFYTT